MSSKAEILKAAKPILFNTDMLQAILEGRKTVTRRLPSKRIEEKYLDYEEYVEMVAPPGSTSLTEKQFYEQYPPYQPGDYLYVRETWCRWYLPHGEWWYEYKATSPNGNKRPTGEEYDDEWEVRPWRPSIHMPKEAARIFLRVTDVRVERVQDITVEGCKKEGIYDNYKTYSKEYHDALIKRAYPETFRKLWNSTIKKIDLDRYGWDVNPWVWVIEFERVMPDD